MKIIVTAKAKSKKKEKQKLKRYFKTLYPEDYADALVSKDCAELVCASNEKEIASK
jgi:hypothetical protein|tara:strand:+ start:983 stop:1150 length:168 start_codon:yes stop_codon:yes gene_type:complete